MNPRQWLLCIPNNNVVFAPNVLAAILTVKLLVFPHPMISQEMIKLRCMLMNEPTVVAHGDTSL